MKNLIRLVAFAMLLCPGSLLAQEENARGPLMIVNTWRVDPGHLAQQNEAITKVADAARKAGLTGPGASWYTWTTANSYTLAYPIENFAMLDTPNGFEKLFEGTPGEAAMKEAFASMQSIPSSEGKSEIVMLVPDWTYEPNPDWEAKFAEVSEYWIKAGQQEAWDALVKDAQQMRKDAGWPHPIHGHRVLFGDTDRVVFVSFYDDRSQYHGEQSWEAHLEKAGLAEDWQKLGDRFLEIADRWESHHITYQPDLSYVASDQGSSD